MATSTPKNKKAAGRAPRKATAASATTAPAAGSLQAEVAKILKRTKKGFTAAEVRERVVKAGGPDDRRKVNNALAGLKRAGRAGNADGRWTLTG